MAIRRSTVAFIVCIEAGVLAWWAANLSIETGIDPLQYQRMASSIVREGLAPWVLSPLSYVGIYPGSDSSGVPFLAAMLSMQSASAMEITVLLYDAMLFVVLGLGLFLIALRLTRRRDVAFLSMVMGSLAFGFFTTLSWSLDERSFNVALLPIFLVLILPREGGRDWRLDWRRLVVLTLFSAVMLVSHLSFVLLVPFVIIVPPLYRVVVGQSRMRLRRSASILYFVAIGVMPFLLLSVMSILGLLSSFGLDYSLSSSALFTGSSPLVFVLNSAIFLAVRTGPVNLLCAVLGFLYLATRPSLSRTNVALGSLLVAGFLGLPVVLYSKDLLTPLVAVTGAIGIVGSVSRLQRRRMAALIMATILIGTGSVAFNAWNQTRTLRSTAATLWTPPGVPPEAQDVNAWIAQQGLSSGCVYGNNGIAVEQVALDPAMMLCGEIPVDYLIMKGTSAVTGSSPLQVLFVGFDSASPGAWFTSPELNTLSQDFLRLRNMDFATGRALLLSHNVGILVIALEKPTQVPLYAYEGSRQSSFYSDLWSSEYPMYRSVHYAVFFL